VLTRVINLFDCIITNFLHFSFDKAMEEVFKTEEIKGNPENYREASRLMDDNRINQYKNDVQNPETGRY
jgi:hypothetical protein